MPDDDIFEFSTASNRIGLEFHSEGTDELLAIIVSDNFPLPDEGEKVDISTLITGGERDEDVVDKYSYIVNRKAYKFTKVEDYGESEEEPEEWLISRVKLFVRELDE